MSVWLILFSVPMYLELCNYCSGENRVRESWTALPWVNEGQFWRGKVLEMETRPGPSAEGLGASVIMAATISGGENQLGRDQQGSLSANLPSHSAARVSQRLWLLPLPHWQFQATPYHYLAWWSPRRVRVWPLHLLTVYDRCGQPAFIRPPSNKFMSRYLSVPSLALYVTIQCQ